MRRRRSSKASLIIAFVFFAFASIYWIVYNGKYMFTGTHNNIDQLLSEGELQRSNEYIAAQVYGVVDCYAETTHRRRYLPTRRDYHYIIWLNNGSFISLSVTGKSRKAELDRLCDETWKYVNKESSVLTTNPILLEGRLTSLSPKIESYYQSYLEMYGILDSGNQIHYLELDCRKTRASLWIYQIFLLLGAAGTGFLAFTKYSSLFIKNNEASGVSRREKNFMTLNSYKAANDINTGNSYSQDSTYDSYTGTEKYYTGNATQESSSVKNSFAENNPGNNIFREYYNNVGDSEGEGNTSASGSGSEDKIPLSRNIIKEVWEDEPENK